MPILFDPDTLRTPDPANVATIQLHLLGGLLMAAGVRWGGLLLG